MYQPQGNYPVYPQQGGYQSGGRGSYAPPGPSVSIPVGDAPGWNQGLGQSMFTEKSIRSAFVSKVYSILTIQLAFTAILIAIFISNANIKNYFIANQAWAFAGLGIFLVTYIILICSESARRTYPINLLLLAVLTIGLSLEAAIISCQYDTQIVMYAAVTCAVSTLAITAFSRHTAFDMTNCGCVLYALGMIHLTLALTLGLILAATGYGRVANLMFAIFGAFLVMCYLVFDTQLILGGKKHELSAEEYILASILLFTDIVTLFLYLLQIFKGASDD